MTLLTPEELSFGASQQEAMQWWDTGEHNSTAESPRDLAEAGALLTTDPISPEGGC